MPYTFSELRSDHQLQAGGKASTLAQLYRRGFPVPDGLVILPAEFDNDDLKPETRAQVRAWLARLRKGRAGTAFAVRSSASSEDSAGASFAGEFESVLDVQSDEDVLQAIGTVRRSRSAARVQAYSQAQGIAQAHEMAVIVQQLVRAEFSGVLFTADPVSGDLMHMTGNAVRGLGEKLVSGEANPQTFSIENQGGKYSGPPELKPFSRQLYRLAQRLDRELGCPQDIEWALAGGQVQLLQSRPITTLREFNPATGEINSSLSGDFLWSNGNAAEIQPGVMTLLTWSVFKQWGHGYGEWWSRYPASGNIGGRNYFNISIQVAPLARIPGIGLRAAMRFVGDWWGRIPQDVTVPLVPVPRTEILLKFIPIMLQRFRLAAYVKQIPDFASKTPGWCRDLRGRIGQLNDCAALAALWRDEIAPYFYFGTLMASVANSSAQVYVQAQLAKLVGDADANALFSNLGGQDYLMSLGPLVNLARVARGELSREAYLEQYGHRGPYEFELAQPQPMDDPAWLDQQLADFSQAPFDVEAALEKQRAQYAAAWQRFCARYPRKVKKIQRQLADASERARQREVGRSEATRIMGVIRCFALRAGELTGLGEDLFHLTIDELLAVLGGDRSACAFLPARRETYRRYCALPPYPPVISGRFDPFQWAADPQRRTDVYDAHTTRPPLPTSSVITGFPGAAGVVEGRVRRIDHVEDSHVLQPGEILVTMTTNVGWTPIFPRAAAIVTDVGAPLSHAAIVARELGIPAVVGCNDATMRLKTGDRVRLDGGKGTVEILAAPSS